MTVVCCVSTVFIMKLIRRNKVFIFTTIFAIVCVVDTYPTSNKEATLNEILKNHTEARSQRHSNNEENTEDKENVLKTEAQKMLKQCDVERNSYNDNSNKYNTTGDKNFDFNKNNRNSFRQDRESNSYGNGNDGFSSNSWSNNKNDNYDNNESTDENREDGESNRFRNQNNKQNEQQDINSNSNKAKPEFGNQRFNYEASNANSNSYGSNNMNSETDYRNRNNVYGGGSNNRVQSNTPNTVYGSSFDQSPMFDLNHYPQNNEFETPNRAYQSSSTNNAFDMGNSYSANSGFNREVSSSNGCRENIDANCNTNMFGDSAQMAFGPHTISQRHKRYNFYNREDNQNSEDNQCISQCIFDYLRLLDYDKTPSETLLIKWLQEHVTGNDLDRIKALRNARSCFTKLTASDIDDGCELSKELSKCLELELE